VTIPKLDTVHELTEPIGCPKEGSTVPVPHLRLHRVIMISFRPTKQE
jgi:hypothetical protein